MTFFHRTLPASRTNESRFIVLKTSTTTPIMNSITNGFIEFPDSSATFRANRANRELPVSEDSLERSSLHVEYSSSASFSFVKNSDLIFSFRSSGQWAKKLSTAVFEIRGPRKAVALSVGYMPNA